MAQRTRGASPTAEREAALVELALGCPAIAGKVVPGTGNANARLVLVGEAPGEQEERQGRPFVGRSGQLLDRMLHAAGLERADLWITNAVKVRPIRWDGAIARNRPPRADELRAWASCLKAELALLNPRVIVGLGAVAGKALLGPRFALTRHRGTWQRDHLLGRPTLITWHPSYLLRRRQAGDTQPIEDVVADLRLARAEIERAER